MEEGSLFGRAFEGAEDVLSMPCSDFVGSLGHHGFFLDDAAARSRLASWCEFILDQGVRAFVDREYPAGGEKAVIVNLVDASACLVDGNAHMVALVRCWPEVTLASLANEVGRADFVRIWKEGWERGSGQSAPYDVYVPPSIDVSRVPGAHEGTDWFKDPPMDIAVIPPTLPFDSPLFAACDRGRKIGETVRSL